MDSFRLLTSDSALLRAARETCAARHTRAWLVGGSVRDVLLGRAIHDFDLAVEHDAIGAARATAARLAAPMYVLDAERDTARIVTFDPDGVRIFIDFAGLREPTIEADLAKRDFTINAMAVDLVQPDRLIDPFGGRRDLEAGVLRAVSDRSLRDDPVRMLRGVRLASGLSFRIEEQTQQFIRDAAVLIRDASAERGRDELAQIIGLPGAARSLSLLDELGVLNEVLPELRALRGVTQSPPHHWDVFEHTLRTLDVLEFLLGRAGGIEVQPRAEPPIETVPDWAWADLDRMLGPLQLTLREHLNRILSDERPVWLMLKWAALYHDAGKPSTRSLDSDGRIRNFGHEEVGAEMIAGRLRALRFSGDEAAYATAIVRHHMRPHHLANNGASRRAVYRFFRDTAGAGVAVLLHALADDLATNGPDLAAADWTHRLELTREMLADYFNRRKETIDPQPLITGHDIMDALELRPGPEVGRVLEAIREAQAAGEVHTREEALALARRVMRET
ncbi:MAG TPA: HD domain-containing protein [Anaerolineae bacterium]|nr:HD domain-containing protein [Anaerolineae bacterium]